MHDGNLLTTPFRKRFSKSFQNLKLEDFQTTVPQQNEVVYTIAPQMALMVPLSEVPTPILGKPRYATNPTEFDFNDLQIALDTTQNDKRNRRFLIYPGRHKVNDIPSSVTFVGMADSLVKDRYEKTIDIPEIRTELNGFYDIRSKVGLKLINLYFDGQSDKSNLISFNTNSDLFIFNNVFRGRFPQEIRGCWAFIHSTVIHSTVIHKLCTRKIYLILVKIYKNYLEVSLLKNFLFSLRFFN